MQGPLALQCYCDFLTSDFVSLIDHITTYFILCHNLFFSKKQKKEKKRIILFMNQLGLSEGVFRERNIDPHPTPSHTNLHTAFLAVPSFHPAQKFTGNQDGGLDLHSGFTGDWNADFRVHKHSVEESTERLFVSIIRVWCAQCLVGECTWIWNITSTDCEVSS